MPPGCRVGKLLLHPAPQLNLTGKSQTPSSHQTTSCFFTHPDIKFDVLVSDRLYVEAHCGDGVDRLPQLQLVEDSSLASSIQAQHQDPHLLVPKHLGDYFPHLGVVMVPPLLVLPGLTGTHGRIHVF